MLLHFARRAAVVRNYWMRRGGNSLRLCKMGSSLMRDYSALLN